MLQWKRCRHSQTAPKKKIEKMAPVVCAGNRTVTVAVAKSKKKSGLIKMQFKKLIIIFIIFEILFYLNQISKSTVLR